VEVVPATGAVNVPPGDRIILRFSERIVPPQTGRAFFVSPRQSQEPRVKWHGDWVEIILPDSFKTDQTYIITPSTSIADLRGNRFDSLGAIAFSTGAIIDTGHVAGAVFQQDAPKGGLTAALFEADLINDTTVYDSLHPTYLAQTNVSGQFAFDYLPNRTYQLIAFDDRNRDDLFDPYRESFALADRPVALSGDLPLDDLRLNVTHDDTTTLAIRSASYGADRLLRVRLSRKMPLDLLKLSVSNALLRDQTDTTRAYAATAFAQADMDSTNLLTLYFGDVSEGTYRAEIVYDAAAAPLTSDDITVAAGEDKTAPSIVSFEPGGIPQFVADTRIRIVFSELLDTSTITPETFSLWRDTVSMLTLERTWRDAFHLDFSSPDLKAGETYRFGVTEFEIVDPAGNALGDSLLEYTFSTIDPDSLGSVSGSVTIDIPAARSDPAMLTLRSVSTDQEFTIRPRGGTFLLDVPAGAYILSGFLDRNLDGALTPGSIHPFRLAETQAVYPDTVKVRARFETAGIEFLFR